MEIESTVISCPDEKARKVTVSIGAKTYSPESEDEIKDFIHGADEALYKAKDTGRNRVVAND